MGWDGKARQGGSCRSVRDVVVAVSTCAGEVLKDVLDAQSAMFRLACKPLASLLSRF